MPRAERRPWSPFYWADWLADPAVRAMSREERGGYIDVLAYSSQTATPGRMLENDVRAWAGYTPKEWPRHREAFARCFRVRAGVWTQRRMRRESERGKIIIAKLRENGRAGGIASAYIRKASVANGTANGKPCSSMPQSQSQSEESNQKILPDRVFSERSLLPEEPSRGT